jgi:hypothetical protein
MNQSASDVWFVRLPDSSVVRANSTRSVRHHITAGAIPPGSYARRSSRESWTPLHRLEPFADLLADFTRSRREARERTPDPEDTGRGLDSTFQLHAVGVRGLLSELVSALDSTLTRRKLTIAFGTCLIFGLLLLLHDVALSQLAHPWALYGALGQALCALLAGACGSILLNQLTFIELSQLRPARLREAVQNLSTLVLRLLLCYLVVVGSIGALLSLVNWLPGWLILPDHEVDIPGRESLALLAVVVQILLEVVLLPLLGFALLLGPILVVEERSVVGALVQWVGMIRAHLRRLFLYESLAAVMALIAALPFLVPVGLAALTAPSHGAPGLMARATLDLLLALAITPAVAYLSVANVFIYLNLRYELPARR